MELNATVVYTLLIINKAGGLVYNREFHEGLNKLPSNDLLVLAGTFHGVHAITRSLTPASLRPSQPHPTTTTSNPNPVPALRPQATGLEVMETGRFRLTCFLSLTGTKFLLFTEPAQPNIDAILKRIYELYADFVTKNPFYTIEMPIRCEKFDRGLDGFVKSRA
ncbi:Sybindin-like protein [Saccharata proteae CBS 121410]|uniref:Trafficking protein particle complex subunit n=1 Tax=Saccharata proteae CBS 121410 TaxID=1314787 RepID=A0A9P4HXY1_9PEZI|nr:Sybindin-like protein [Saccharata proteae CBS 121410]